MVAVNIRAFGGMVPATEPRLLPDQAAAYAENTWLYSGALVGIVAPEHVRACSGGTSKVYRIPNNYTDAEHLTDAIWLEFANIDTDVIRSPIADDMFDRYYWASPVDRPRVNSRARIKTNQPAFALGVVTPNAAPTLTISGGASTTMSSRAYVVTWVSAFGEESAPSTPVLGTGKQDASWNLTLPVAGTGDISTYNLSKARIYRTVTSSAGQATYFFVTELPIATTTYSDTASDTTVSSNEQLASTAWTPPPEDLAGWIAMPNGMIAGWRNNELWFCEPYRPHAWPAQYTLTVEYPIIGLGVINQTLVVCTAGYPMVATGINPASVTLSKLTSFEPCMSRGSIVSAPEGVYYASPNGLILVANGMASVMTKDLIMKDEWQRLLKASTLRATRLGSAYFCYGSARFGVFDEAYQADAVQQDDFSGSYSGALIDLANQRVAFNVLSSSKPTTNVFSDPWSGETLLIREDNLYRLNIADEVGPRKPLKWRSKIFQANDLKNFQAMRIYFDVPPWAPELNPVRNTDLVQTLQPDQYGLVRVYADKNLVMTRELRKSGELMRLPSGFKADFWQVEIEAVVVIQSFQMATSVRELLVA